MQTAGATGGDVTITIGPTIKSFGSQPDNVDLLQPGAGSVFFGSGITANTSTHSTPPEATDVVSLNGANVIFSAGGGRTPYKNIVLGGGDFIEADPTPPGAAALLPASVSQVLTNASGPIASATGAIAPGIMFAPFPSFGPIAAASNVWVSSGSVQPVSASTLNVPVSAGNSSLISTTGGAVTSGAAGAFSNSAVLSTVQAQTANEDLLSGFPGNASSDHSALTQKNSVSDASWISDTEITTGEIPAVVLSDERLGIESGISTLVEMTVPVGSGLFSQRSSGYLPGIAKDCNSKPDTSDAPAALLLKDSKAVAPFFKVLSVIRWPDKKFVELKKGSVLFAPSVDTVCEDTIWRGFDRSASTGAGDVLWQRSGCLRF